MKFTTTMDSSGRLVLPKKVREKLGLSSAARLDLKVLGDAVYLSEAAVEPRIERRDRRRVIVGWKGFDAGLAVRKARQAQAERSEAVFGQ